MFVIAAEHPIVTSREIRGMKRVRTLRGHRRRAILLVGPVRAILISVADPLINDTLVRRFASELELLAGDVTAMSFVRLIVTIVLSVAVPRERDARNTARRAFEFVALARFRFRGVTVDLVGVVAAIVLSVTLPVVRDASTVVANEVGTRAVLHGAVLLVGPVRAVPIEVATPVAR